MRIAYIPFGVTRPLLDEFCRTHSTKHASERAYTTSLAERGHIPIRRGRRRAIIRSDERSGWQKNAVLAYIPQDANVLSKGTPFMGEEVEIHKKNDIHKSVCHFFVKKCFFDLISPGSHQGSGPCNPRSSQRLPLCRNNRLPSLGGSTRL